MNEARVVRRTETREQLPHELDRAVPRYLPDLLEVLPVEQLHRIEQPAIGRHVGLMDAHHVRVIDSPDRADLVHEQPTVVGARIDVSVEDLDRDIAFDRELTRAIHGTERAAGDHRVDPKPAGQHGAGEIVGAVAGARPAGELRAAHVPQTTQWR